MRAPGAYGDQLRDSFGIAEAPAVTAPTLKDREIVAATLVRSDTPLPGVTKPMPREDAFLLAMYLREIRGHRVWEDGITDPPEQYVGEGETAFYDLRRRPIGGLDRPFHAITFYLPRRALNELAYENGSGRIEDIVDYRAGAGHDDPVIRHFGLALLPSFERPDDVSPVFLEHVMLALRSHVATTYCGMRARHGPPRGGLAPWQVRRAQEALAADLSLAEIAEECRLSIGHFARAFRRSTGVPPHRWLLERRVERAKELLRASMPLAEVAVACGFNDQSHFTRVFSRVIGVSPGAWRRLLS